MFADRRGSCNDRGKNVSLLTAAGIDALEDDVDALTVERAKEAFRNMMRDDMPVAHRSAGCTIEMVMTEIGKMSRRFRTEGYEAPIAGLGREDPRLHDFGTWLPESSALANAEAQ